MRGGVDVEDRLIVGLAVFREDVLDVLVGFLPGLQDGGLHHAPAAVGHHRPFQRGVGLQTDDHIVVLADVAGGKGIDVGRSLGVHVVDASGTFNRQIVLLQSIPDP